MRRAGWVSATTHGQFIVEPAASGQRLLVGFHGYAETAERHLEVLARLPLSPPWSLCAVQGLHHFYRNKGAEVVASWMTRLNREQAIEDNLAYVGEAVTAARAALPGGGPLAYAGFSQGAAMAYRAAQRAGHACAAVVVNGGDVPPDVVEAGLEGFPPVLIGRGSGDRWYSEDAFRRDFERLSEAGVRVATCRFDGGHEWGDDFSAAAGRFLGSVAG